MTEQPDIAANLREQVIAFFQSDAGSDHDAVELADRFAAIAAAGSLPGRIDALVRLVEWTRLVDVDAGTNAPRDRSPLFKFVQMIECVPAARRSVQDIFADILARAEGVNLFGDTGIRSDRGFFSEFATRMARRLLPQPSDEHDLSRLSARLYSRRDAVERLRTLAPEVFHRFVEALTPPDRPGRWAPLRTAFGDGFRLLAIRAEAQGMSPGLRARSHPVSVADSPFCRLARTSAALMDAWTTTEDVSVLAKTWHSHCAGCRHEIGEITRRLETDGVSVEIIHRLEVLEHCLARMQAMVEYIEAPQGPARSAAIQRLLTGLIFAAQEDRSLRHLIRSDLQRVQRTFVDRAGRTGESYAARNLREYWRIWVASAGGGLVMVLTVAIHLRLMQAGLRPWVEGVLAGLNYAIGFVALQHLHLMLAIKQPSMIAASLADLLRGRNRAERLDGVAAFTVSVCRSQFAAAAANVIFVFLGAFLFVYLWHLAVGREFLGVRQARDLFPTLSLLNGGTVIYAALTGGLLFLAAMIGGWFDNWVVMHRLPQAIADYRPGRRFGRKRLARFAGSLSFNAAGWGTSISLGLLLGLTPVFGTMLGVPLEVRHVTLSSGMLALVCASLDGWFSSAWFFWTIASVATWFVLNLSVSFFLALYTAARAYGVERRELAALGMRLLRRMLSTPLDFVLPERFEEQDSGRSDQD